MAKQSKPYSDQALVQLSLKQADHFGALVDRYEKKLFRYIRRLSNLNRESAEDILQESFIKIYTHLNSFDKDLKFSTWAYRITHNETINYLRKNKKAITIPLETDDEQVGQLIDVLRSEIDIEKETEHKALIQKIHELIYRLPKNYREVLILRYIEDLDYREISDILKIPMGTVATTLNRAKKKFKQIAEKNHLHTNG